MGPKIKKSLNKKLFFITSRQVQSSIRTWSQWRLRYLLHWWTSFSISSSQKVAASLLRRVSMASWNSSLVPKCCSSNLSWAFEKVESHLAYNSLMVIDKHFTTGKPLFLSNHLLNALKEVFASDKHAPLSTFIKNCSFSNFPHHSCPTLSFIRFAVMGELILMMKADKDSSLSLVKISFSELTKQLERNGNELSADYH